MLRLPELGEPSQEINCVLLWSPDNNIPDETLDKYIEVAKDNYGYDMAQALGLLVQNDYNIEQAVADMPNYMVVKKQWTDDEKKNFEVGFKYYGKQFGLIQSMLPDKSVPEIIEYYYKWKMTKASRKRQAISFNLDETPDKRPKQEDSKNDPPHPKESKPPCKKRTRRRSTKNNAKKTCKTVNTTVNMTFQPTEDLA